MTISVQHTDKVLHETAAAFIRGNSPLVWLREVSRWKIDIEQLSCYILPQSIHSPLPAGLFVVMKDTSAIPAEALPDPYGVIAGKLFISVHSFIYPLFTKAELEKILIWDVQVLHPVIGLVGFEKKDAVSLKDMFNYTAPAAMKWDRAHPGLPARPPLQQIKVMSLNPENIINTIREELGTKPLKEIPGLKEGKITAIEKALDLAKYGLFKGLYTLTKGLTIKQINFAASNKESRSLSSEMMEQLQNWLAKNIDILEKKRQDEIQRLLKMFEDNTDEALKYAIPLDSPYLNRGKAAPTLFLMRRSVNLDLRNLSGGGAVDRWDLGDRYHDLRSKYMSSAQKQIEKGDFKKAAYIYAHLMGDFSSAANVLVQGKYYREAAGLYKDHLKNPKAAAECLENGGLVMEAIEVYKELDFVEKVGDLYKRVDQQGQADIYFEKSVERFLMTSNYLEASRVLHEKKHEDDRAKQMLLEGWSKTQQAENCLKMYFDIVAPTGNEQMKHSVETVYKDVSASKQSQFLNVLLQVKQHYADKELEARTIDIAYEIASNKANENNYTLLPILKQFVLEDRLLSSDVSRYIHNKSRQKNKQEDQSRIKLDTSITWVDATWYHNQVIVVGTKDKKLYLARCNWYNDMEYYTWANDFTTGERFTIVANPYYSNRIIIKCSFNYQVQQMRLPRNKYFDQEIIVNDLGWLPVSNAGIMLNNEGGITLLDATGDSPLIHEYSIDGKLEKSKTCKSVNKVAFPFNNSITPHPLQYHGGYYYTATDRFMVSMDVNGMYSFVDTYSSIRIWAISTISSALKLVASTNAGCMLIVSSRGELQMRGDVFATGQIPSLIQFISADRVILAEKNRIIIYEIIDDDVLLIRDVVVSSKVIAVIPSTREKFGVVEECGEVTLHEI